MRTRPQRILPYANYKLQNLNRTNDERGVFVRLQLSTQLMNGNVKFPLELGRFSGQLTTKQIYEELIATLQDQIAKMPV